MQQEQNPTESTVEVRTNRPRIYAPQDPAEEGICIGCE